MSVIRALTVGVASTLAATAVVAGATPTVGATTVGGATGSDAGTSSRLVLRDGTGDVWKFYPRTEQQTRLDDFPLADVTRAVVAHGTGALSVRMRFADIRRVGTQLFWVHVRTPRYQYDAVLSSKPGSRAGSRYFQGDDGSRSCRGFTRTIGYAEDVVALRIPRGCLHDPRWVRVGIFNQLSFRDAGPRYFDTPLSRRSPVSDASQTRRLFPAATR